MAAKQAKDINDHIWNWNLLHRVARSRTGCSSNETEIRNVSMNKNDKLSEDNSLLRLKICESEYPGNQDLRFDNESSTNGSASKGSYVGSFLVNVEELLQSSEDCCYRLTTRKKNGRAKLRRISTNHYKGQPTTKHYFRCCPAFSHFRNSSIRIISVRSWSRIEVKEGYYYSYAGRIDSTHIRIHVWRIGSMLEDNKWYRNVWRRIRDRTQEAFEYMKCKNTCHCPDIIIVKLKIDVEWA